MCAAPFAVRPDEAPVLCRSVQAMVEFLAVTGRLDGGVASAARLMMHVDGVVDDVADALGDDANFGIGKTLGDVVLFDADGNELPDLVDRFVDFVATNSVKLTDAGNISMGDARKLVAALGTGDVLDQGLSGRPKKNRSSTEQRWLTLLDDVATYSGAVERLRTKLRANEMWGDLPIAERATRMVHGVLEAGPLCARIASWDDTQYAHRELLDDGVPHWLSQALPEGSFLDYAEIEELAIQVTQSRFTLDRLDGIWPELVASRLAELFEVLEVAGIITWHDLVTRPDRYGVSPVIVSGSMSLTPLGRAAMVDPVRQAGYTFATIDDLADADGLTLVNTVGSGSLDEDGGCVNCSTPTAPATPRPSCCSTISPPRTRSLRSSTSAPSST